MADVPVTKQKTSRHWIVAIGALIIMIGGSVPLSGLSFYNPYLFSVMPDSPQASILLYFTLLMLSIVVSMIFIGGPALSKVNPRVLMITGSIIVAAALLIFMNAPSPFMLYVAGVVLGLGYGFSFQLIPILWVNNWFVKRKGLVVGLVTAGTGFGGIAWSFMVPALGGTPGIGINGDPESFRRGYLIMAIVVLVVVILPVLFMIQNKPQDVGLQPYGAEEARADAVAATQLDKPIPGFTYTQALRTKWLWLICAMSIILGVVHSSAQIVAPYLTMRVVTEPPDGMGGPLGYYSLLMMTWTLGLIIIKPTLGVMNDKLGILWAMGITLSLQAVFFAIFLPNIHQMGTFIPFIGMIFMSAGMSNGTVQPPLITATAMGNKQFGKIWSVAGAFYTLGQAVGAPIWGAFYDPATGSYTLGFMLAPVALAIYVIGSGIGMRGGKKQHMDLYEQELAEWEAKQAVPVPAS
ncbi:MAG TPA: MFS transporter [Actinomycetaceae bacterium]|nr:MFS transporter [Actinomycetaceae bacterium]